MKTRVRKSALFRAVAGFVAIAVLFVLGLIFATNRAALAEGDSEPEESNQDIFSYHYEFTHNSVLRQDLDEADLTSDATFVVDTNTNTATVSVSDYLVGFHLISLNFTDNGDGCSLATPQYNYDVNNYLLTMEVSGLSDTCRVDANLQIESEANNPYIFNYHIKATDQGIVTVEGGDSLAEAEIENSVDINTNEITRSVLLQSVDGFRVMNLEFTDNDDDCDDALTDYNYNSSDNSLTIEFENLSATCEIEADARIVPVRTLSYKLINEAYASNSLGPIAIPATQLVDAGSTVSVAEQLSSYSNWIFHGWYYGDQQVSSLEMPNEDVELTGYYVNRWTQTLTRSTPSGHNCSNVFQDGAEAVNVGFPVDWQYKVGEVCRGYEQIVGWQVVSPVSGTVYYVFSDGTMIDRSSAAIPVPNADYMLMPERDTTISPILQALPKHTVSYALKEGSESPEGVSLPSSAQYYETQTVSLESIPTAPNGWRFLGWYHDDNFVMGDSDVVIEGEWQRFNGEFSPTIEVELENHSSDAPYEFADTVEFQITVSNEEEFALNDIVIEQSLAGAEWVPGGGMLDLGNGQLKITSIPAESSVTLHATWKNDYDSTDNYTNAISLVSVIPDAEYYYLTTPLANDSVSFQTRSFNDSPFTFFGTGTGTKASAIVKVAGASVSALAIGVAIYVISRRRTHPALRYAMFGLIAFSATFSAAILLQGDTSSYADENQDISAIELRSTDTENAWEISSSLIPHSQHQATLALDLTSDALYSDEASDIIFVLDSSNSYDNKRWSTLVEAIKNTMSRTLANGGRAALIDFNDKAKIDSVLTDDYSKLKRVLGQIEPARGANYAAAFEQVEKIVEDNIDSPNLKVIFVTDGYSTGEGNDEQASFDRLKLQKPNLQISAIQYEMGMMTPVDLARFSDEQYAANADNIAETLEDLARNRRNYDNFEIELKLADGVELQAQDLPGVKFRQAGNVATILFESSYVSGEQKHLELDLTSDDLLESAIVERTSVKAELDQYRDDIVSSIAPTMPQIFRNDATLEVDE